MNLFVTKTNGPAGRWRIVLLFLLLTGTIILTAVIVDIDFQLSDPYNPAYNPTMRMFVSNCLPPRLADGDEGVDWGHVYSGYAQQMRRQLLDGYSKGESDTDIAGRMNSYLRLFFTKHEGRYMFESLQRTTRNENPAELFKREIADKLSDFSEIDYLMPGKLETLAPGRRRVTETDAQYIANFVVHNNYHREHNGRL